MAGTSKRICLNDRDLEETLFKWYEEICSSESDVDDVSEDHTLESDHDSNSEIAESEGSDSSGEENIIDSGNTIQMVYIRSSPFIWNEKTEHCYQSTLSKRKGESHQRCCRSIINLAFTVQW
nr:unnamed protein product [Callosobruchus chinensis]